MVGAGFLRFVSSKRKEIKGNLGRSRWGPLRSLIPTRSITRSATWPPRQRSPLYWGLAWIRDSRSNEGNAFCAFQRNLEPVLSIYKSSSICGTPFSLATSCYCVSFTFNHRSAGFDNKTPPFSKRCPHTKEFHGKSEGSIDTWSDSQIT